jgi:hypothetical protein
MAKSKPQQSLADYVTIALSPLLIMALVGSLVFFLLEVLYSGQFEAKLRWTMFFFVFAMVLVARISIELSAEKAGLYGLAMIAVCWLALSRYIEYPEGTPLASFGWLINLGLMVLIWWSAHRLTWDCTYIDDTVDASGQGVLEAAGLDQEAPPAKDSAEGTAVAGSPKQPKNQPALLAWWDRYRRYREEQLRKPHTPGVWVVYFSLAALPLFGLGQALIPAEETERRRYVFWLMVYYVASGLGLLLTTCFLGLRRYLRQRKLQMPAAMTGIWLALGGGLVVVLMVFGALLPRPYGEYQLAHFTPVGSEEREASRYDITGTGKGKGEGKASSDPNQQDDKARDGAGAQRDQQSRGASTPSSRGDSGKGGSRSGGRQGGSRRGQDTDRSGARGEGKGEERGDAQKDRQEEQRQDDQNADQKDAETREREQEKQKSQGGPASSNARSEKRTSRQSGSNRNTQSSSGSSISGLLAKLGWLGTVLKWIVFIGLAVLVVFFLLKQGLQFLANFTNWARRLLDAWRAWWAGLVGAGGQGGPVEEAAVEQGERPRPFAAYGNPFTDGRAEQLSPDELARYSFEALQAWAWEHDLARAPEETPLEFAARLGPEVPALEAEARGVAGLYARSVYGRGRLTPSALGVLQEFWRRLENVERRPLSA